MLIKQLNLNNFRSYEELDLALKPGINIFIGRNGEGKTNIVESLIYLSFLSSHRTASDQPLVKLGNTSAYIRCKVMHGEREISVELELNADKANRAKINGNPTRSQKEIFGIVQAVYFSPEDLDLVRGDPAGRRRFMDEMMVLRSPRLAAVLSDYDRALRQRNSLLKLRSSYSSLAEWDEQVAKFGGEIIGARLKMLAEFTPFFSETYQQISAEKPASLLYKSAIENPTIDLALNQSALIDKFKELKLQELDRGLTLAGPHRDDLILQLAGNPVKGYASHGESWSISLALKLGMYKLLRHDQINPLLILDDVFSELDEERRAHLINLAIVADQTLITVAVQSDLPTELSGTFYSVKSGSAKRVSD
jgi:DNA replication and repair protein RecF